MYIAFWLLFGVLIAVSVLMCTGKSKYNKKAALVFYVLIILSGPLVLLLVLMPTSFLRTQAKQFREKYLDE